MSDATSTVNPSGSAPTEGGRRVAAQAAAAQSEPAADISDSELLKKKQKKNRSSLSKVKGRKGALKAFNALPLDLVLDICSYLDPADLYVLSNTSKVFRAVVTGPSSAQLWIDARARVGLPELELPMTDLQYAAHLFGRGCQFCKRKNAGKPEVYFRARICSACLKSHFVSPETAKGRDAVRKILPREHLLKLDKELQDAFPEANYTECIFLDAILGRRYAWREVENPTTPFQKWVVQEWKPARDARFADGDALTQWLKTQEEAKTATKKALSAPLRPLTLLRLDRFFFCFFLSGSESDMSAAGSLCAAAA
ncbi:hypothetical protein B0A53_06537 [Rhodotorula sp. CCFEE 5036]|nr:hypothetical protein B0A53_06537 [Rhodotorula sp. CCFEE 5036]